MENYRNENIEGKDIMKIRIFKEKNLEIDLPKFIDSRALICANSGGGKSYAVRKILEESSNKVLSIILDVEGEFKTLREAHDFLLVGNGEGDDVKLSMKSAKLLPEKIMGLEIPTIIDVSDLKNSERIKYIKDFLEALMELPRKGNYWKPCIVVLDEAHKLAGQQEKQDSCSAVIDLMTRGRKRGYCGVLCTQRISKLHKDAVAECNNILIGRTGLDIDMKRAAEILGFTNKKDMLSLRDLEAGEFFVFGTAISRYVTKAKVGEVRTTHPKVGMDLRKEIIKPTKKVIEILSKIKDLPQEAEKKLKEVQDYKNELIELKRKIRMLESSQPKPGVDEKRLERERVLSYNKARSDSIKEIDSLKTSYKQMEKRLIDIGKIVGKEVPKFNFQPTQKIPEFKEEIISPVNQVTHQEKTSLSYSSDGEYNLNLCEKKLYSLLFQYSDRAFTKSQIGVFTGYSHKSGGFNNAISHLRQMGLIEGSGGNLRAKELIADLSQEYDFSKEAIIGKLNKCEREIYQVLLDRSYDEFTKEELALNTATSYSHKSGGFNNAISRLNTLGLLERENGMIKLNPELLEL